MDTFYTNERNTQILISLMKTHGVRKVIASPGTTNISLVASLQQDPFFEVYSSVDERSAAYIACGMAAESGEAVALSCTGATASRNYIPGLTEAFYRKLPVLAITSTQHSGRIGQNVPQVIDRTAISNDIAKLSIQVPSILSEEDEWAYSVKINEAILELFHNGGGPVHINLTTTYSRDFSVKELPSVQVIDRVCYGESLPPIAGKIGIFVGAHKKWNDELTGLVDSFCEIYNAVVLCDHTSNYQGKYGVLASLMCSQTNYVPACRRLDVLIHIGDVSGSNIFPIAKEAWRVNPDGMIRDTFKNLRYTFEMKEEDFFRGYVLQKEQSAKNTAFYKEWKLECDGLLKDIPELPFSNVWLAQNTIAKLPEESVLHLGILNSLRTWNFFEKPKGILGYSNTGGFGIDGNISSVLGASLAAPDKLFFAVIGDLAFFYDMNALGNRHFGKNVRLLVVNNGRGTEFRNFNHPAARFGEEADKYMAAAGHYGQKSPSLIKNYAEDLGFEYMSASGKKEYLDTIDRFLIPAASDKPMVFEVFTDSQDESDALEILYNLKTDTVSKAKQIAREVLGEKGIQTIRKIIKK